MQKGQKVRLMAWIKVFYHICMEYTLMVLPVAYRDKSASVFTPMIKNSFQSMPQNSKCPACCALVQTLDRSYRKLHRVEFKS